jgi:hypothetical protein
MHRRPIGYVDARGSFIAHAVRHRYELYGVRDDFLAGAAPAEITADALADSEAGSAGAQRLDDARHLGGGREWQFGLELILAAGDESVEKVEGRDLDPHQRLAGAGNRIGHVLDDDGIRPV